VTFVFDSVLEVVVVVVDLNVHRVVVMSNTKPIFLRTVFFVFDIVFIIVLVPVGVVVFVVVVRVFVRTSVSSRIGPTILLAFNRFLVVLVTSMMTEFSRLLNR